MPRDCESYLNVILLSRKNDTFFIKFFGEFCRGRERLS